MTAKEARQTLDVQSDEISRNVADYMANRIDDAEFHRRQVSAHSAIEKAGQRDNWRRRWRTANP